VAQGAGRGSVPCAPQMQQLWADSIGRVTGNAEVRRLPSGAGHDAMVMARITDMGMLSYVVATEASAITLPRRSVRTTLISLPAPSKTSC